ncbi:hypothetical protein Drose_10910 [Dactylosporangium roseum]|uniref:DUF1444 domain-containing protein n=1 Tax=Dactylosporangium roseum TaxID=47989 RepID=A0ABY5Z9Z8_9ACTN|nr:hypothetical protein [Dactylosporangium roseum]UWZ38687.1 hypothetical protein Drose_10910 [Dactylosporangium roseum]
MGLLDKVFGSPRERFARQVLTAVRDAGVAEARYLPEQFAIQLRRDSKTAAPSLAYLGNLFRECDGAGRTERRQRIAAFLAAVVFNPGAPDTWEAVAPLLRPLLRSVSFGLGVPGGAPRPVRRPALPYLAEFVVVDQPTSIMYVTPVQLATWGVTERVVYDRARANLTEHAERTARPDGDRVSIERMVESGDAYWASHLLVDGWLAAQGRHVGGRPVVFVPDTTGVVLAADHDGIDKLFGIIEEEYREAARPISTMGYTVDGTGAVVPYSVPVDHPLFPAVHRAEVLLASNEYAAQAAHLETDAFVAKLMVAEGRGRIFSVAGWAEGVDTLLPRADYVSFPSGGADPFLVAWDDVAREVDLEPEPDLAPERYRLRSWPHPGVVERLRRRATDL